MRCNRTNVTEAISNVQRMTYSEISLYEFLYLQNMVTSAIIKPFIFFVTLMFSMMISLYALSIFIDKEKFINISSISFESIFLITLFLMSSVTSYFIVDKVIKMIINPFAFFFKSIIPDGSCIDDLNKSIYNDKISNLLDINCSYTILTIQKKFNELKKDVILNMGFSGTIIYEIIKNAKELKIENEKNNENEHKGIYIFSELEIALKTAETRIGILLNDLDNVVNKNHDIRRTN